MGYQINLHRSVSRSIRRTYRKTLDTTARILGGSGDDRVHEARTSVKRARMLLRLMRHDTGRSLFRRENGALREASRALSAVRDAVVLVETLEGLVERASEEDRTTVAPLRAALEARRDRTVERSFGKLAEAARAVNGARDRAADLTPAHRGWKALAHGLDRAYRRAHDRCARAFETGRDEDFHALRRAVKDLTYQARFLRPVDEPALRAEGARLKKLGDLLGDDHDLAVLRGIDWQRDEGADPAAVAQLGALAAARRTELQNEVHGLAEALLAERPEPRLARLEVAFRAARERSSHDARPAGARPGRLDVPARGTHERLRGRTGEEITMAEEIERKFLVRGDAWRAAAGEGTPYRQGYLSTDGDPSVRVRLAGERGYLTLKSPPAGASRKELEYEIPAADARYLLDHLEGRKIEKTRYRIPYQGHTWEIDDFQGANAGLLTAEIELGSEAEPFARPDWVGDEVTSDPRYSNVNLAVSPFTSWSAS
jgi:adenylate cyclase